MNGGRVRHSGRVSLLPRHVVAALPEDDRVAVELLEQHLHERHPRREPALEVLPDGGVGVFLTIGYVQDTLRAMGARKTGEDYAAEIINTILPRLGLTRDTGLTKKPRTRDPHATTEAGGRHAQPQLGQSFWWRIFPIAHPRQVHHSARRCVPGGSRDTPDPA